MCAEMHIIPQIPVTNQCMVQSFMVMPGFLAVISCIIKYSSKQRLLDVKLIPLFSQTRAPENL